MKGKWVRVALVTVALGLAGTAALASAETIQVGGLRVGFDGRISPHGLPRVGSAPVKVAVGTTISAAQGKPLPQLTKIVIAINRNGNLDPTGLPICEIGDIQPATTQKALEACPRSLVGEGTFSASVALSKQASFPSEGKLLAFNGVYKGKPAILAHVFGTDPIPVSFTVPFVIGKSKGTFGTTLTADFPAADDNFVTGIGLTLHRTFTYKGKQRSYATASCPAPKSSSVASFPFAKASLTFKGGPKVRSAMVRSCRAL
jgi:hypothetical protein